jgi:hypothetical protein
MSVCEYISWCLLELCTNVKLSKSVGVSSGTSSRLFSNIKSLGGFDAGIKKTSLDLLSDSGFISLMCSYKRLSGGVCAVSVDELSSNSVDDSADDELDEYELECELFVYVNDFVGLYTISTLHGSDRDLFMDKLCECLRS